MIKLHINEADLYLAIASLVSYRHMVEMGAGSKPLLRKIDRLITTLERQKPHSKKNT